MPIRLRLTVAFSLAMIVMLTGAGLFVYLRLQADLDDALNAGLRSRADAIATLAREPGFRLRGADATALDEAEESFAQLIAADGRVLAATAGVRSRALSGAEVGRALNGIVLFDRRVPGVVEPVRVLARPIPGGAAARVVAVAQSRDDRDETLARLVTAFGVGGPVAVVLASLIGYLLARSGLAPVEAMRRHATEVSLDRADGRLPVPRAHDEVRRLGETLNDMLARLHRSFEHERRFVADASHELRTPIAVVKTELEAALRSGDGGPEIRQSLAAAVEECDHLAQLAEDLLVLARAAEGKLPVHRQELTAWTLLSDLRERFRGRAAQRGRTIAIDADDELCLRADGLRLRQALGNLIDNALRYGAGTITLGCRTTARGVELEVTDEGPGFGEDIAERAFERFTRGDRSRSGGGTGLGLAIVAAIAEAHDGSVVIAPGPGAHVRLTLPDDPREASLPAAARRRPAARI